MVSKLLPFARSTLFPAAKKYILPHATAMAKNVALDVINSKQSFGNALKEHGLATLKNAGSVFWVSQALEDADCRRVNESSLIQRLFHAKNEK